MDISELSVRALLNSLPEGAYITDLDRRILYWNKAAEQITGWPADEVVGRSCFENILCHIDKDGHPLCGKEYCPLHRSIVTEAPSDQPLLIFAQTRSGRRVPVEVTVAPLRNGSGEVVGGIELFRDVTESVSEIRRAKVIQENALRCPLPRDNRLEFAVHRVPRDMIGGDFHRIEHLGGAYYAVFVADVAGHGVSAALYAMQLRALWEDLRPELRDPGRFCAAINRRVRAIAPEEGYFATAVHLVLNAETGQLAYVRAGHPAPLIRRADGAMCELGQNAPALGMVEDASFETGVETLAPGDTVLAYTDGAIEVSDLQGRELGVEGLVELFADGDGAALPDLAALEEQLLAYSSCIHLPDDITLIAVRRVL